MKRKIPILILFVVLVVLFIKYDQANEPIIYTENSGNFYSNQVEDIVWNYEFKEGMGFNVSLDFKIKSGVVLWQIEDPEEVIIYEGRVYSENNRIFRELIYPENLKDKFNKEIVGETDTFPSLQIDTLGKKGMYRLIIKPNNSEGTFRAKWSDRLPSK